MARKLHLFVVVAFLFMHLFPNVSNAQDAVKIRWGMFNNYNPIYVAVEKGFIKEEGIDLEFSGTFTSGPAVVQAAATGNIDAGHSAISGIVNAINSGIKVVGVADSQTEFRKAPLMQWFVLDRSNIRVAKDLRGKTIGVNSLSGSFYNTLLIYLKRNNIPKEDVHFMVIPHHNQEQALRSKQIDVAGLIDPYSIKMLQTGGVRTLFRAVDVLGERQFSLIFFTKQFIDRHPEAVVKFVRAYRKAINYLYDHPAEATNIIAKYTGVSAELGGTHLYTRNAEVRIKDAQFWIDIMRLNGELVDNNKIKAGDVCFDLPVGRVPRKK